jgi:hypothetical protein
MRRCAVEFLLASQAEGPLRRTPFLVALIFVAICVGCSASDSELEARIAAEVARGPGTEVRMRELTDFAWDRLHVFEPYSSRASIESELGFAWPHADSTGIDANDGVSLLVFVQNNAVVRYLVQPRGVSDFSGQATGRFLPADAVFRTAPRGDGALIMIPVRGGNR